MALANDQMPPASCIGSVQVPDLSSPRPYAVDEFNKAILGEETCLEGGLVKNIPMSHSSPLFGPSSMNSNAFLLKTPGYQPEEAHSFIDFKSGYGAVMHSCESLLSFEQNEQASQNSFSKTNSHKDEYSMVGGNFSQNYQRNQVAQKCGTDPRLLEEFNCFQTASNFSSITNATTKEGPRQGDGTYGWLYTDAALVADSNQGSGTHQSLFHKRAHEEETSPAIKKNSTNANKKAKPNSSSPKDPQSIAAKNRRERISERLKILQELVPNGSKVDLVTMLEKAISYVKFLQLQVKVLATDEFWPAQGGKAPDISQVKEAIDAILSSQKDRNSSS